MTNTPILYTCEIAILQVVSNMSLSYSEYVTEWVVETEETLAEYEKLKEELKTEYYMDEFVLKRRYERVK